jgi:hypothetical protein
MPNVIVHDYQGEGPYCEQCSLPRQNRHHQPDDGIWVLAINDPENGFTVTLYETQVAAEADLIHAYGEVPEDEGDITTWISNEILLPGWAELSHQHVNKGV